MVSTLAAERIAKKAGVNRIAQDALEELRDVLIEIAQDRCKQAVSLARHAKRKTVLEEDILFVCRDERKQSL
ncbi:MAG: NFYB/HAP3 family transcription factor subunit [Candidatus Aenigmarchaeota archaeon]|nr:NFYB/HAP3 family transcription factor subunit [Candidatus Aenigmarchaeota archaeon]